MDPTTILQYCVLAIVGVIMFLMWAWPVLLCWLVGVTLWSMFNSGNKK